MLYLYDEAITEDLKRSFNPHNVPNPVVKVVNPEGLVEVAAQLQEDQIQLPIVALLRNPNTPIDKTRTNFTAMHRGIPVVMDTDTHEIYHERVIPIELRYALTALTTNQADLDELVRELLFKYTMMYFLTIRLPYESDRKLRFGVVLDRDSDIEYESGSYEYISGGKLYQAILPLKCEGCILVHNVPQKIARVEYDVVAADKIE